MELGDCIHQYRYETRTRDILPSRDSSRLTPSRGCECGNVTALRISVDRKIDTEKEGLSICLYCINPVQDSFKHSLFHSLEYENRVTMVSMRWEALTREGERGLPTLLDAYERIHVCGDHKHIHAERPVCGRLAERSIWPISNEGHRPTLSIGGSLRTKHSLYSGIIEFHKKNATSDLAMQEVA